MAAPVASFSYEKRIACGCEMNPIGIQNYLRGRNAMKRNLLVILVMASLVLSFSNAFAAGPAPQFGITTSNVKLGDLKCDTWSSGMHQLIVDSSVTSTNVYAVRLGGLFSESEVIMDKSNDGGLTWLNSTGIARNSGIAECAAPVIAINPVTKDLHYAWSTYEPLLNPQNNIYYGNGTIATRVNGSFETSGGTKNIAVDQNGVIHIVFVDVTTKQLYYTSSTDNGSTFSGPDAIPQAIGDWISFTADSAGNLYLSYDSGRYFMIKLAGGQWSSSYPVCPSCVGADPSMAVYDSSRIYIARKGTIFATSNSGQTWTEYSSPGVGNSYGSLAVDSNGILNYSWQGANSSDIYFARTDRSNDPLRWGTAVLALSPGVPKSYNVSNIAVDSAGKAYITAAGVNGVTVFTKEN